MSFYLKSDGFSLMELMIVVAIIGILTSIGLPSYQKYLQKARFAEVLNAADLFKTSVALALQEGYALSDLNNGKFGIPAPPASTKNLTSIKVENGVVTASGTTLVNNSTYILTPNEDGSVWTISGSCLENGLCRG